MDFEVTWALKEAPGAGLVETFYTGRVALGIRAV